MCFVCALDCLKRLCSERNFDSGEFEYSNIRRRIGDAYLKYSIIDIKYSNIWHIRRTRIVLLGLEYSKFRSLRLWNFRLCISCIVMNFNGSLAWALFVDCYSSFMNL